MQALSQLSYTPTITLGLVAEQEAMTIMAQTEHAGQAG